MGTHQNRLAAGLFGGLAMAVQALLPLLLAAEIRLADAGELPICAPAGAENLAGPVVSCQNPSRIHHHGGIAAASLACQAAAIGHAFTGAAAPSLSTPQSYANAAAPAFRHIALEAFYHSPYRARAPPARG